MQAATSIYPNWLPAGECVRPGPKRRMFLAPLLAAYTFLVHTPTTQAMIVRMTIAELARTSDLVVITRVELVYGIPFGRHWAKARVVEVWKGPSIKTLTFLASPRSVCDTMYARMGETALLFLAKDRELGWVIQNAGNGRMPLYVEDGEHVLSYPDDPNELRLFRLSSRHHHEGIALDTVRDKVTEPQLDAANDEQSGSGARPPPARSTVPR